MNTKIEVHKNHLIGKKLEALNEWEVPAKTKKEVREFIEKAKIGQINEGRKLSEATISKYLTLLKKSLQIINKPTSKITKEDLEKYDKKISSENLKTAGDYKLNLQIFLRWALGNEKANKIGGWLDIRRKNKTPDYLTEQEIIKLFKNCKNPSERFLIAVLFDSGARIEEFLNIRYEDIQLPEQKENYVKITLKEEYSKTKGRVISLYWDKSLESVRDFLKERESEGIKSSEPVFNKTYDAVRMFLLRLGKRILNKQIYPHLFRHSSATYYAAKMNRQELCYRYGWAFSSDMPDIYISRSGMNNKELDEKFKGTELETINKENQELRTKLNIIYEENKSLGQGLINLGNEMQEIKNSLKNRVFRR